jgi:hypothetical protein
VLSERVRKAGIQDSLRRFVLSRKIQRLFRRLEYAFIAKVAVSGAKIDLLMEQLSMKSMLRRNRKLVDEVSKRSVERRRKLR